MNLFFAELSRRLKAEIPPPAPSFALELKRCGAAARPSEAVSGELDPLEKLESTEMV